jgi:hypothetical protein
MEKVHSVRAQHSWHRTKASHQEPNLLAWVASYWPAAMPGARQSCWPRSMVAGSRHIGQGHIVHTGRIVQGTHDARDFLGGGIGRGHIVMAIRYVVVKFSFPEAEFMNVQFHWSFWAWSWEFSHMRFLHGFLKPLRRGYGFLSGFPPFSFTETVRGCMSLKI